MLYINSISELSISVDMIVEIQNVSRSVIGFRYFLKFLGQINDKIAAVKARKLCL